MDNQYNNQPQYPAPQSQPGKGLAITSMVLGIVSLVMSVFGVGYIGIPCAIVGIVLGAIAKKKGFIGSMASAGIVMSIISIALGLIVLIACAGCAAAIGSAGGLAGLESYY